MNFSNVIIVVLKFYIQPIVSYILMVTFRYRKSFPQLVEEDRHYRPDPPNYTSAEAPPSPLPPRHFCAVCGYFSNYTCVCCGTKYCSVKCLSIHVDTRCQKWTA